MKEKKKTVVGKGLTLERSLIGDVVYEENAHGTAIVGCRNGSETFLAGGIPDLQLDALAI
jgi:hypothetical protein